MKEIKKYDAVRLSWEDVSVMISEVLEGILGKKIVCEASPDAHDYWSVAFFQYRMPMTEIQLLIDTLGLNEEDSKDCLPCPDDTETDVGSIGLRGAIALLKMATPFVWTKSFYDENYIWLIIEPKEPDVIPDRVLKENEFDFGGDDSVIGVGPKTVDISKLGYFDDLEYDAWDLIKAHASRFGIELCPKYPEDWEYGDEVQECIDFHAAKTVVEAIIALFEEAGVQFITDGGES